MLNPPPLFFFFRDGRRKVMIFNGQKRMEAGLIANKGEPMRSADKWRHEINQKLAEPAKHKANPPPPFFLLFSSGVIGFTPDEKKKGFFFFPLKKLPASQVLNETGH